MALIKTTVTSQGTEFLFSQYQDAYKKAQRIEARTGYKQDAKRTNQGYLVIDPSGQGGRQSNVSVPSGAGDDMMMQQQPMPENLGYEAPPKLPPGLYDGKW